MDFYYGKTIEKIDIAADSAAFSNELLEYIYLNRNKININLKSLFAIDPYDDQILHIEQIKEINVILKELLDIDLWDNKGYLYDELEIIYKFTSNAIKNKLTIVSIGD